MHMRGLLREDLHVVIMKLQFGLCYPVTMENHKVLITSFWLCQEVHLLGMFLLRKLLMYLKNLDLLPSRGLEELERL